MKRILIYIGAVVATIGLLSAPTAPAAQAVSSGYVNASDIEIIQTALEAHSELAQAVNSSTSQVEIEMAISKATSAFDSVANHSFSTKLGKKYTEESIVLQDKARTISEEINGLTGAIESGDEATVQAQLDQIDTATTEFENQIDVVNGAVEESNSTQGNNYLWMLAVAGILAVASFVWAFRSEEKDRKVIKARRTVAYASLAPLAGAAITYVSFMFADKLGGTYMIAWGPMLIGVAIWARTIVDYRKAVKEAKNPTDIKKVDDASKKGDSKTPPPIVK